MSNLKIAIIVTVLAALLAVVAVVVTVRILGDRLDSQPAPVVVHVEEDGSGFLPEPDGRLFCVDGGLCEDKAS